MGSVISPVTTIGMHEFRGRERGLLMTSNTTHRSAGLNVALSLVSVVRPLGQKFAFRPAALSTSSWLNY